ncbi:AbrB/MazE/SpoVT family DNA-binding domain-containing protein [Saccharolobus caldissimus]|uniref:AbrB family transcriptional regulator n=1 Tax=Saccharolobus caldissimus TaxID=1702097 RepID=A0AAQ4CPR5_9CREN|nr:phosphate uptake regulator PhoU [Saccharolobus caldissimus]BDB97796.1 AbrB family transcriptional regulator [Saccharolobus caldissimus]
MTEERISRDIETRKVQKLGSSSLFVTLPKKWINKWNIKPGDKVILESLEDGSLRLIAEKAKSNVGKRSIIIDVDSLKQPLINVIPCLYSLGYDEIIFETKKDFNKKDAEDAIFISKHLVGAEVVENSEKKIKLECLLDTEKVGVESLLRRILNIISRRIDDLIKIISNQNVHDSLSNNEDLRKIYLMLLRRIIGNKYQSSIEYYRNSFILMNISILLNIDYIVSKISKMVNFNEIDMNSIEQLKTIFGHINDVLDEIIMSVLFPSVKRVSNGFNLISQIKQIQVGIRDKLPQVFNLYLEDLVNLLENALNNSMCGIFLEDLPWIEKDLTV